jgi:hypothetical protein
VTVTVTVTMAVNKLTHAVVQLIAALSYKPEGGGFDF